MPGDQLSREEVRTISRDEMKPDLDRIREEISQIKEAANAALKPLAEASAATAKAVERLSLIVAGDDDLEIDGLAHDVKVLKAARQETLLEKAKVGGILIGALAVGTVVVKALLYLFDKAVS